MVICTFLDDYYYVLAEIIHCACEDEEIHSKKMCPEAEALFFSFLLNTRFDKQCVWTPKEIIESVRNGRYKNVYEGTVVLNSSVSEDEEAMKRSQVGMSPLQSLITCANYRATGCTGKVKLVVTEQQVEFYKDLVKKLNLPLHPISPTQARDEIKAIHDSLFEKSQSAQ